MGYEAARIPNNIADMDETTLQTKIYPITLPDPFPKKTITYAEATGVAVGPIGAVNAARLVAQVAKMAARAIEGDWKTGAQAGSAAFEGGLKSLLGDVSATVVNAFTAGVAATPEEAHEGAVAAAVGKYARKYAGKMLREKITPDQLAQLEANIRRVFGFS